MTDHNEKLIEEARRWPRGRGVIPSAAPGELIPRLADALEAAEKALTPTDDERGGVEAPSWDTRVQKLREAVAAQTGAYLSIEGAEAILETVSPKWRGEPSDAKVEAAARRLFGATVDSMTRARELARVALAAPPLVECPHWAPGKITFRNGCTACAADAAGGVR